MSESAENEELVGSERPSSSSKKRKRLNEVLALLSLLLATSIPFSAVFGSHSSFGKLSDFPEYYAAMRLVLEGRGPDIYRLDPLFELQHKLFPQMEGRGIAYYIPPFATCLLSPIGLLPAKASYWLYICLASCSLVSGCALFARYFQFSFSGFCWMLAAVFFTGPAFESLKIAQLAPFLFLALSAFLLLQKAGKPIAAALFLSILFLKPQELLPIAVYLLFSARFKILFWLIAMFLVSSLVSVLQTGPAAYLSYFELLKDSAVNTQFMQPELSATIRGQLLRAGDLGISLANSMSALLMALGLAVIAYAGYKSRGKTKSGQANSEIFDEGFLFLVLPLGIITALHCHDYDLLLLLPWVLASFKLQSKSLLARALQILLALFYLALTIPIYVPIHYLWLMQLKQTLNPLFLLFFCASLLSASFIACKSRWSGKEEEPLTN